MMIIKRHLYSNIQCDYMTFLLIIWVSGISFFLDAIHLYGNLLFLSVCSPRGSSSASSSFTPTNLMSSFTTSINLHFGIPLLASCLAILNPAVVHRYIHHPPSLYIASTASQYGLSGFCMPIDSRLEISLFWLTVLVKTTAGCTVILCSLTLLLVCLCAAGKKHGSEFSRLISQVRGRMESTRCPQIKQERHKKGEEVEGAQNATGIPGGIVGLFNLDKK